MSKRKSSKKPKVIKEVEETKVEEVKVKPMGMVRTHDMTVSGKLQKQGCKIVSVTGGTDTQVKTHYLATTKDEAIEKLKAENEKLDMSVEKKRKLNEKESETIVETDTIIKTNFPESDLEDRLKSSPKVKDLKGEQ